MKRIIPTSAIKSTQQKEESSSMPKPEPTIAPPDVIMHLKKYHACLMVATTMVKSFHYCVVGYGFFSIHPQLGEYWDKLDEIIDEVAELIVILKGVPVLTMKEALELSTMPEFPFSGSINCKQAMIRVEAMFNSLANVSGEIALVFDELGNIGNSGLIGDHYNYYTKSSWMVRSFLKEN